MAVKAWQTYLKEKDLYKGEIDGKFGPETVAATKKFQADNGENVTGKLDGDTVAVARGNAEAELGLKDRMSEAAVSDEGTLAERFPIESQAYKVNDSLDRLDSLATELQNSPDNTSLQEAYKNTADQVAAEIKELENLGGDADTLAQRADNILDGNDVSGNTGSLNLEEAENSGGLKLLTPSENIQTSDPGTTDFSKEGENTYSPIDWTSFDKLIEDTKKMIAEIQPFTDNVKTEADRGQKLAKELETPDDKKAKPEQGIKVTEKKQGRVCDENNDNKFDKNKEKCDEIVVKSEVSGETIIVKTEPDQETDAVAGAKTVQNDKIKILTVPVKVCDAKNIDQKGNCTKPELPATASEVPGADIKFVPQLSETAKNTMMDKLPAAPPQTAAAE